MVEYTLTDPSLRQGKTIPKPMFLKFHYSQGFYQHTAIQHTLVRCENTYRVLSATSEDQFGGKVPESALEYRDLNATLQDCIREVQWGIV